MNTAWQRELWSVVTLFGLAVIFGLATRHLALMLVIFSGGYLCWHLIHLARLYRWLVAPSRSEQPRGIGAWEDIYYAIARMQQRHRRSKQRLSAILAEFRVSTAALPDAVVVLDAVGRISWFNEAATDLLGLRLPQDLGQRLVNLLRFPAFVAYMQRGDYSHGVEAPAPEQPDHHLLIRVVPYGDDQRLLIARDVTELKRLEQTRRDFVANASHELRTPLTVLRGYLDMMDEEARESEEGSGLSPWRVPISDMRSQARRMGQIVNDMLTLARLDNDATIGKSERVDVPSLCDAVLEQAQAVSQGRHHFETSIDRGLFLDGRSNEMHSALANLVINAVQHTPPKTVIRVQWWHDEHGAHFRVADNGPGIPEEDIPRVTERFYRVDVGRSRGTGGTGLGLAIVKHVVDRHQGRMQIKSKRGEGCSFTLDFPERAVRADESSVSDAHAV